MRNHRPGLVVSSGRQPSCYYCLRGGLWVLHWDRYQLDLCLHFTSLSHIGSEKEKRNGIHNCQYCVSGGDSNCWRSPAGREWGVWMAYYLRGSGLCSYLRVVSYCKGLLLRVAVEDCILILQPLLCPITLYTSKRNNNNLLDPFLYNPTPDTQKAKNIYRYSDWAATISLRTLVKAVSNLLSKSSLPMTLAA